MINVFVINTLVVSVCVVFHYEFMYRVSKAFPAMHISHRYRILIGIFAALIAHSLEIWLFALAYFAMHNIEGWGYLEGNFDGSLMDCGYFSFTVFTTLGFGDIQPNGHLRYLTGIESLTGLVLITWTASFLFVEMQRHWAGGSRG